MLPSTILLRLFTGDDRLGTRLLHLGCMIDENNKSWDKMMRRDREREREKGHCSAVLCFRRASSLVTSSETALPEPAAATSSVKPKKWRAQLDWRRESCTALLPLSLEVLWLCAPSARRPASFEDRGELETRCDRLPGSL